MGRVVSSLELKSLTKSKEGEQIFYDQGDLTTRNKEDSQVFIPTLIINIPNQKLAQCGSIPCKRHKDCPFDPPIKIPLCSPDRFCAKMGWCPENIDPKTKIEIIQTANNTDIIFHGFIDFPELSDKVYQSTDTKTVVYFPKPNFNRIKMNDILKQTSQNHTQLLYQGGEFEMKLLYDCDVGWDCLPQIKIEMINSQTILNPLFMNKWQKDMKKILQIDSELWNYQTLNYFEETSFQDYEMDQKRFYQFQVGYKVNIEVMGVGKKFSLYLFIIQIAYALIFNIIIQWFCDFILMNCYSPAFVRLFYKYKYTKSKDFTDLRGGIEFVEDQQRAVGSGHNSFG